MGGGAKKDLAKIAERMKNPKAKLIMEEALVLVDRAMKVEEEGFQLCLLCKVEVGHLVEHYTFHYTVERPGALLSALATSKSILRCPIPSCSPNEMELAELNLHLATEHDLLKKVLEVDVREGRRELLKVLFFNHGQGGEEEQCLAEEEGKVEMADDSEVVNNEREQEHKVFQLLAHRETTVDEESVKGDLEVGKDDLEVGEVLVKEEENVTKKEVVVDKKDRKKAMNQALDFIKDGGSLRKASWKFDVPLESLRSSLYRKERYKHRVGVIRAGRPRRVFDEEEEVKFAGALHKRFNLLGEKLDWRTLRVLMQKHLQNLVRTNSSRVTGWELNNQRPNESFLRRFAKRNNLPIFNLECRVVDLNDIKD